MCKAHLLDKLACLEKRGTLQSAEQFIELAASRGCGWRQALRR